MSYCLFSQRQILEKQHDQDRSAVDTTTYRYLFIEHTQLNQRYSILLVNIQFYMRKPLKPLNTQIHDNNKDETEKIVILIIVQLTFFLFRINAISLASSALPGVSVSHSLTAICTQTNEMTQQGTQYCTTTSA